VRQTPEPRIAPDRTSRSKKRTRYCALNVMTAIWDRFVASNFFFSQSESWRQMNCRTYGPQRVQRFRNLGVMPLWFCVQFPQIGGPSALFTESPPTSYSGATVPRRRDPKHRGSQLFIAAELAVGSRSAYPCRRGIAREALQRAAGRTLDHLTLCTGFLGVRQHGAVRGGVPSLYLEVQ
jgi:hypothetical protein